MAKILIVDDEQNIRTLLRKYVEFAGFQAEEAENGLQAVSLCSVDHFDLIIMDIMMPEMDGFTALRQIRKSQSTPVLMLSAKGEEMDRLKAFDLGVDDYVVKPFSAREVVARISAILRRGGGNTAQEVQGETEPGHTAYQYRGILLDYTSHRLLIDGVEQKLTLKEYELLEYFIKNKGIALTRDQLLSAVWGFDFYGDERTLDTHIKLLRNNLGPYRDLLTTIRGVGYRYEEQ